MADLLSILKVVVSFAKLIQATPKEKRCEVLKAAKEYEKTGRPTW